MNALDRTRELVAETLGIPLSDVQEDANFEMIEKWDSIGHMRLMLAVEERIGRPLSPDETTSLFSVPEIARLLE